MPTYRVCKRFTVESGHMLSKHPEHCRFPHGHTRIVEVVVAADRLDENDMVVDFKALKLAIGPYIERYDHAMAMAETDPRLQQMQEAFGDAVIAVDGDPTTENLAREVFEYTKRVLAEGFETVAEGISARIRAGTVRVERVRVWETPTSWAEVSESPA
jgi:6-pyruvoyltetrahydropterin/6-carboxytetrahydropterin synthase